MKRAELVFIPSPGPGHLISTVEIAKLLISRDKRLFITILIMKFPWDTTSMATYTQLLQKDVNDQLVFVDVPHGDSTNIDSFKSDLDMSAFYASQTTQVRRIVGDIVTTDRSQLAGFVIDMFCTPMIDVANEFGVPTYAFFTSSAAFLGLIFYLSSLNQDFTEYNEDSDVELSVPSFVNLVPTKVLPSVMMNTKGSAMVMSTARRLRETKAIVVNTFLELEAHALKSLTSDSKTPTIYHAGPIINLKNEEETTHNNKPATGDSILNWLDNQTASSVVFLCFGSKGSFDEGQVREIARALERSGHRFLWSLRRPHEKGSFGIAKDCENPKEVLPEGFLKRTADIGKVIGWAPQVAVLSHPAVGGFVSHCGWNSTLESIWFGVPMATWPMYAEQQINAFELVKELGMAVDIKMDYRRDFFYGKETLLVTAEEIENGIRKLMDGSNETRKKVQEMKDKSRMAMMEGGSSYTSLGKFIEDVMDNISSSSSVLNSPISI